MKETGGGGVRGKSGFDGEREGDEGGRGIVENVASIGRERTGERLG